MTKNQENFTCKYLPGICYSCQKCLYCFQYSQNDTCKCKKNKQPSRTKRPKRGQQIYQRVFTPNQFFSKANEFLFDASNKFGYNSNFEKSFSYTLCNTCNSKSQRLRRNDKKTQKSKEKLENDKAEMSDVLSNEEEIHDNEDDIAEEKDSDVGDNDKEEYDGIDSVEDEDSDDNDLEEIKIQIIVKSKNIKEPTAKILTINPVDYDNVMKKIN